MTADPRPRRPATRTGIKRAPTGLGRRGSTVGVGDEQVLQAMELPDAPDARVAIYEPAPTHGLRAREAVTALGYPLADGNDEAAARAALLGADAPDVLIVGVPGGEPLIEAALTLDRQRPVLVAALAAPIGDARARARAAGCDLFALRPHTAESLGAPLAAAAALAVLRQRVVALEGNESLLRERLAHYGEADVRTGFQHIDFFKHHLLIELKRARRYGYPLALCLIAIDPGSSAAPRELPPKARAARSPDPTARLGPPRADAAPVPRAISEQQRQQVAAAIATAVRDIDVPVELTRDRVLVCLPHADLAAAAVVGHRVADAVRAVTAIAVAGEGDGDEAGTIHTITVSVGIAAPREGEPASLARVMREAAAAVRAAQLKGGDCVVVRK